MMQRRFGMDIENIVKEKSSNHIVLKSRSFSFDNQSKAPGQIVRRASIVCQKPPVLNGPKNVEQKPLIIDTKYEGGLGYQEVPDYYQECVRHMMSRQTSQKCIKSMKIINPKYAQQRQQIISWMISMHDKLRLFPETLFIAVNYMDQFASKQSIQNGSESIVAMTCMLMSGKFEETYNIPSIKNILKFSQNQVRKEKLIEMEEKILQCLGFKLISQIPLRYLDLFAKIAELSSKNRFIAHYLVELSLLEEDFISLSPSIIGSAAIYLVNKIRKISPAWPKKLQELTRYHESELKHCAKQLCVLLEKSNDSSHSLIIKQKFAKPNYFEASKIRLQKKAQ